jgi:nitrogen PTS system EIIA component
MIITEYMNKEWITSLKANNRNDALKQLVDLLYRSHQISDPEAFYNAIIERESIVSTGIGMGIAIPHAKLSHYKEFFIAIGILDKPVDWNALDSAPVRYIFLIGGPDDKQTEYLQILSYLTQAIKSEEKRKQLQNFSSPEKIIELFNTNC